jgi:hypothetical protein
MVMFDSGSPPEVAKLCLTSFLTYKVLHQNNTAGVFSENGSGSKTTVPQTNVQFSDY